MVKRLAILFALLLFLAACAPNYADYVKKAKPPTTKPEVVVPVVTPPSVTKTVPSPDLSIPEGLDKGKRIPDFEFPLYIYSGDNTTVPGTKVSLYSFLGKKVFINLWSTYCGACINDMPSIQEFYMQSHDVVVLTVCLDGMADRIDKAIWKYSTVANSWDFPILLDEDKELVTKYSPFGLPTSYFIDEKAVIRNIRAGGFGSASAIEAFCKQPFVVK